MGFPDLRRASMSLLMLLLAAAPVYLTQEHVTEEAQQSQDQIQGLYKKTPWLHQDPFCKVFARTIPSNTKEDVCVTLRDLRCVEWVLGQTMLAEGSHYVVEREWD